MLKIMPFWLWVVVMGVLLIVGISGEPMAFLVVAASVGLTLLVAFVRSAWASASDTRGPVAATEASRAGYFRVQCISSEWGSAAYGQCPLCQQHLSGELRFPPGERRGKCPKCEGWIMLPPAGAVMRTGDCIYFDASGKPVKQLNLLTPHLKDQK